MRGIFLGHSLIISKWTWGFFPKKNCNLTLYNYTQEYDVMTELDFFKNIFGQKNGENRPSPWFLECIWKFSYFFFSIWSIMEVYINYCMLWKILDNFGSWDICQNGLGLSDCRIFKYTMSLKQNHEKVWFFACW